MAPGNELERMAEEIAGLQEEVRQLREALTSSAPPAYLTTREVARIFKVSYETVRRPCCGREVAGCEDWPPRPLRARGDGRHPRESHQARPGTANEQLGAAAAEQTAATPVSRRRVTTG
jgi:hypothetical protein